MRFKNLILDGGYVRHASSSARPVSSSAGRSRSGVDSDDRRRQGDYQDLGEHQRQPVA